MNYSFLKVTFKARSLHIHDSNVNIFSKLMLYEGLIVFFLNVACRQANMLPDLT